MSLELELVGIQGCSPNCFHLMYPNLFHEFATPAISPNYSYPYPIGFDCNNLDEGDVS